MSNLDLSQWAEGQSNPEVTSNDADAELESAITEVVAISIAAGNATISDANYRRNIRFDVTGGTVARDVTLPAIERAVIVSIDGGNAAAVTLKRGSASYVASPGEVLLVFTDGTANGLEVMGALNAMDIGVFVPGLPGDDAVVLRYTPLRPMTIPDDAIGSVCNCEVDPASSAIFTIKRNGSNIGTITIAGGATTGSFTFSSPASFNGTTDVLEIVAPTPQDTDLVNVYIGIKGYR